MVKSVDDGLGGISRRGLAGGDFGELGSMSREERAEKYQRDMQPYVSAALALERGKMVAQYRERPSIWPDGIDSKFDRWYRAAEWKDDGTYVGPEPCVRAANPDPGAVEKWEAERRAKLAKARGALAGVEQRLGVKPFVAPPAEPVAEIAPRVTETTGISATKTADVAETLPVKKPGRPKKEGALTAAERMAAARARKKERGDGNA